jgi:L-lactate dehydrogenase (cytochrome)
VKPAEIAALLRPRTPELNAVRRRLARCHAVADLRATARQRLPRGVFDYIDGGAEDEVSLRRNQAAFAEIDLVPSYLQGVADVDLGTTILGVPSPLPLALAPTGFSRMMHPDGELAVARAAGRSGLAYAVSTMATTSIEDIAEVATGPLWFQLYVWRDRGLSKELIDRAKSAGCHALMLTVDTPVPGARERDLRNGLTIPPELTVRTLLDGARHPHWWWGLLTTESVTFANVSNRAAEPSGVMAYVARQFDPALSWDDIGWMVDAWGGPFVMKGILSIDDAERAASLGVSGIVVSNHGGRQLDHTPPPVAVLPDIVDAVGDRLEVLVDSGVRRGSDIVKALALGARAAMIGRPYLYGLGVAGEQGVAHSIDILSAELRRTMQLLGVASVDQLSRTTVQRR